MTRLDVDSELAGSICEATGYQNKRLAVRGIYAVGPSNANFVTSISGKSHPG
jgi:hypothetical protein